MPLDKKLESYLSQLDKSLGQIPVSERADIVTEIKTHILDACSRSPERSIADVMASFGEPETVANRYLMERGLKPVKAPRSPIVKWLTVGFLGTFGICAATLLLLVWKFSPLISIDENEERVRILGGLIDINGSEGNISIDGLSFNTNTLKISGEKEIKTADIVFLHKFSNAKVQVAPSSDKLLHWACEVNGTGHDTALKEEEKALVLDLTSAEGSKCTLEVPDGLKLAIEGGNGKITLEKPSAEVNIQISNGKISMKPDNAREYRYDLKVVNGKIDGFDSSTSEKAIPIRMSMTNGKISKS